jgi:hypothetical protein
MNIVDRLRAVSRAWRGDRTTHVLAASTRRQQSPDVAYTEPSVRMARFDWTPTLMKQAEYSADSGDLRLAGQLCESMLGDDRLSGCLSEVLVGGLLGLEMTFESDNDAAIEAIQDDFWVAFPEHKLAELLTWGRLLGVSVAKLSPWDVSDCKAGVRRHLPTLDVVHAQNLRCDTAKNVWSLRQNSGSDLAIAPGDGQWLLFAPYGTKRPWARGIWRSVRHWWMLKQFAYADWGRYSERNGMGLLVGSAAEGTPKEYRDELASDLQSLGRDTAIALPPGFDLRMVEATANTWETFRAQVDIANTAIAIRVLGNNLSTEVKGGSFAAASVHQAVERQVLRSLAESAATCLHDQALVWWAEYNFGRRDVAPYPDWNTAAPEDVTAEAATWKSAGEAVALWRAQGLPVDLAECARKFGVPLIEGAPLPESDERVVLRLASGDDPAEATGFVSGQQYVDGLAAMSRDRAAAALSPDIDRILAVIDSVEDGDDWHSRMQAKLVEAFRDMSPDGLADVTEKALILAELAGRAAVLEDA